MLMKHVLADGASTTRSAPMLPSVAPAAVEGLPWPITAPVESYTVRIRSKLARTKLLLGVTIALIVMVPERVVVMKKKSSEVALSMIPRAVATTVPAEEVGYVTGIAHAFAVDVPASAGREVPRLV